MRTSFDLGKFDPEVTLMDAAVEEEILPTMRMVANASLGVEPFDAYYAAQELLEVLEAVQRKTPGAKVRLAGILSADCDDYQGCLYYCLAGRGAGVMLLSLSWLVRILRGRAGAMGEVLRTKAEVEPPCPPYVASQPDGPVPSASEDFHLGPSWTRDPLTYGPIKD